MPSSDILSPPALPLLDLGGTWVASEPSPTPTGAANGHSIPPWMRGDARDSILPSAIFLSRYSRLRPDGGKETWLQTCARVTETVFTILRTFCAHRSRRWEHATADRWACEFFADLFELRFSPSGRGLYGLGPQLATSGDIAGLNSCLFLSTGDLVASALRFLDASILGIGVGFDTEAARAHVAGPASRLTVPFPVSNCRAGWVSALGHLVASHTGGGGLRRFTFEGRAQSAHGFTFTEDAIRDLLSSVDGVLSDRIGGELGVRGAVDVFNLIGVAVSRNNMRRGAGLALGPVTPEFLDLKVSSVNPTRNHPDSGWSWASNNSVVLDGPLSAFSPLVDRCAHNGEPGIFWRYIARTVGRTSDASAVADTKVRGINPCGEQVLEDREPCVLVEVFPSRTKTVGSLLRAARNALLCAKSLTLLASSNDDSDAIIQRNRRVGCSMTGIAEWADRSGWPEVRASMDTTYRSLAAFDHRLSRWLGVPTSVRRTTVKPSGTLALLGSTTSGIHWPVGRHVRRRVFFEDGAVASALAEAGLDVTASSSTCGVTAAFPVSYRRCRADIEVPLQERMAAAITAQQLWSDNAVSFTLTFDPERDSDALARLLVQAQGKLKTFSALPFTPGAYECLPIEPITAQECARALARVAVRGLAKLHSDTADAMPETGCESDECQPPV